MPKYKDDFIEENPNLVYSPDLEVSYVGGTSPTPPTPTQGFVYIMQFLPSESKISGLYEIPLNATTWDDAKPINLNSLDSQAVTDGIIYAFPYAAGKIIGVTFTSGNFAAACGFTEHFDFLELGFWLGEEDTPALYFIMPDLDFEPIDIHNPSIVIDDLLNASIDGTHPIPFVFSSTQL